MEKDISQNTESILSNFRDKAIKSKYFQLTTLGEIEASCYPESTLEVIDYDKTARKLYYNTLQSKLNIPQTCDALRFNSTTYDFIEMKRTKQLVSNNFNTNKDKFLEKDFSDKFTGSLKLFDNLLDLANLQLRKNEKKLLKQAVGWYFVLIDDNFDYENGKWENNEEFLARMNFLSAGYQDNISSDVFSFYEELSATLEKQFDTCKTYLPSIQTKLLTPNQLDLHYSVST